MQAGGVPVVEGGHDDVGPAHERLVGDLGRVADDEGGRVACRALGVRSRAHAEELLEAARSHRAADRTPTRRR